MTRTQSILAVGLSLLVLFASWLALAHNPVITSSQAVLDSARLSAATVNETKQEATEDEKEIVKELTTVFKGFDDPFRPYRISGTAATVDPADSANTHRYAFVYATDGEAVYYKNGGQEALLTKTYSVMGDRELKRILIGPAKKKKALPHLPFSDVVNMIKLEGYRLQKSVSGDTAIVRFLAENNVSCKEMQFRYLLAQKRPLTLFYRFTDLDHFDNPAFDKKMEVAFAEWHVNEAGYKPDRFPAIVETHGTGYRPAKGYEAAEIINLNRR